MFAQKINLFHLLVYSFSLFLSCKNNAPQPKEIRAANGVLLRKYVEINGKIEGRFEEYYADGQLEIERFFIHGNEHGRTVIYYPDGKVKEVQEYDMGKKINGDTIFYHNGNPKFTSWFVNDKKEGLFRRYDSLGNIELDVMYKDDRVENVLQGSKE
ncbi:MAG TPA: hypothetical protein PK006_12455 [Saprospiraceae bacterium]|nr:hypothetical protein [Saprospiraceae bacterium]